MGSTSPLIAPVSSMRQEASSSTESEEWGEGIGGLREE